MPRYRQPGSSASSLEHEEYDRLGSLEQQPRRIARDGERKKAEAVAFGVRSKHFNWKSLALRFAVLTLIAVAFLTFFFPPFWSETEVQFFSGDVRSSYGDKKGFLWVWDSFYTKNPHYAAEKQSNWSQIAQLLDSLKVSRGNGLKIGLLNFQNNEDIDNLKALTTKEGSVVNLPLEHVRENLKWEELFPEWIDEEEMYEVPRCPSLPMPQIKPGTRFDVIAVNVPCQKPKAGWSRDVVRLHVQLAAASVAVSTESVNVLLLSSCHPIPNLFTRSELSSHHDGAWLFKADLSKLEKKLSLPVGSCELAVPLKTETRPVNNENERRQAYATILHSAQLYVCGAIAVAQSIRRTGSTRDLVILVDENIKPEQREGLAAAGWLVKEIKRIRNPKAAHEAYNEWNYSKFRLWQLTEYDKVIFIDADLLILRNVDFLFELPEISATGNNATLFNSGVMVIEPSNGTFELLMEHIDEIVSYNGGDQGYLNEVFTWWHRLPKRMNYLKHFWINDTEEYETKTKLFGADPPELYVLHYLGLKPWLCFRDFDCNWNVEEQRCYASDAAHAQWWKVHDNMPQRLQKYCFLRSKQKASLEWDRRQAEKASLPDEHWKKNITDPRLQICDEKFCFWESMLWHWGDPSYDHGNPQSNKTESLSPS